MMFHQGTWKHKRGKMSHHYRADFARLLRQGWPPELIGNSYGVSIPTIYRYMHKHGLMNTYNTDGSVKFLATENPSQPAPSGVTEQLYKAYVYINA